MTITKQLGRYASDGISRYGNLMCRVRDGVGRSRLCSRRLQTVWLDQKLRRHFPRRADLMNHVDGQRSLAAQDLGRARTRTEQLREFCLRVTSVGDEVVEHVNGIEARGIDRPALILILLNEDCENA